MDDYILMKDFAFVPFTIAVTVAALARVIPYTFAGFGIVELVMVMMFRVFGEGFLGGTTVAILCGLLINMVTLVLLLLAVWLARCPSILETWQAFFGQSDGRHQARPLDAMMAESEDAHGHTTPWDPAESCRRPGADDALGAGARLDLDGVSRS